MTTLLPSPRGAFLMQWSAKIMDGKLHLDAEAKEALELNAKFETK